MILLSIFRNDALRWHTKHVSGDTLRTRVRDSVMADVQRYRSSLQCQGVLVVGTAGHTHHYAPGARLQGYETDLDGPDAKAAIHLGVPVVKWHEYANMPLLELEERRQEVCDTAQLFEDGKPVSTWARVSPRVYLALAAAKGARLVLKPADLPSESALQHAQEWWLAKAKQAKEYAAQQEATKQAQKERARQLAAENAQPYPGVEDCLQQAMSNLPSWRMQVALRYLEDALDDPDSWPTVGQVKRWVVGSTCETPGCGCTVEPDGTCEHGVGSWLLVLGLV